VSNMCTILLKMDLSPMLEATIKLHVIIHGSMAPKTVKQHLHRCWTTNCFDHAC
jgi:hypothetical protein